MSKQIPYCPISREQYQSLLKFFPDNPEKRGQILDAVCQTFFSDKDFDLPGSEYILYNLFLDFAEEKYESWDRRRSNFINNNPKKKKVDPCDQ